MKTSTESIISPGTFIEVGSLEWQAHIIKEKIRAKECIRSLENEILLMRDYLAVLVQMESPK